MNQTSAPLQLRTDTVRPEWIDYNGHMNLAYYVLAFDYATDDFLDYLGLTAAFREQHDASTFAAEIHVSYLREVHAGDGLRFTTQLIDYDAKRLHYFHRMYHAAEGWLAATNELVSLYMDMHERRVAAMPEAILARVARVMRAHGALPAPEQLGRRIAIPADKSLR